MDQNLIKDYLLNRKRFDPEYATLWNAIPEASKVSAKTAIAVRSNLRAASGQTRDAFVALSGAPFVSDRLLETARAKRDWTREVVNYVEGVTRKARSLAPPRAGSSETGGNQLLSATGLFEEIFKAVRDENARRAREGQRLLLISREEANELTEQRELVVEELATDEQIRALAIDLGAWLADIRIKRCRSMLRADSDFVLGRVEGELSKALDFGRRGYSVYVARDVLLGEAQGVMLTTTKLVRDMKGVPLGVYYEIAKLATRPANLRLAVNSDRFARVYGSGRRLVEFAVEECKSRGFSGVYLEASFTAVPFYLRLGFGYGRNVNAEDKRTVGADIMIRPP